MVEAGQSPEDLFGGASAQPGVDAVTEQAVRSLNNREQLAAHGTVTPATMAKFPVESILLAKADTQEGRGQRDNPEDKTPKIKVSEEAEEGIERSCRVNT